MSAIEQAAREAAEAVGAIYARQRFTISRFERHPDGYLHARVVVAGQRFYFHRRYGSWLAPGHINGRAVLKEPEALLGSVLGQEVKYTLSEKSSPYDTADRKEREAKDAAKQRAKLADERRSDDSPAGADRLPAGRDRDDDREPVQDD